MTSTLIVIDITKENIQLQARVIYKTTNNIGQNILNWFRSLQGNRSSIMSIIFLYLYRTVFILLFSFLCACHASDSTKYNKLPPDILYEEAKCSLEESLKDTIAKLDVIERRHSRYSRIEEVRLLKVYTYYKHGKFDEAILAADYYLSIYPASTHSPYAHYIRAMAYYDQIVDVGRDQQITEKAKKDFLDLMKRYPRTPYAKDAYWKLEYIFNVLAAKEADIGRFYLRQGSYLAAINRFKIVITQFDTSMLVPEALYRLVEAYYAMGLDCQAQQYIDILKHNFPDSIWYTRTKILNTKER